MPRNNTGLEDMAHSHSVYRIYENISLARKESRFRDGNGGVGKLVRRLTGNCLSQQLSGQLQHPDFSV
jgi:hypothetical protein